MRKSLVLETVLSLDERYSYEQTTRSGVLEYHQSHAARFPVEVQIDHVRSFVSVQDRSALSLCQRNQTYSFLLLAPGTGVEPVST